MTKEIKKIQNRKNNLDSKNLDYTDLSIQLSLDGFSFCIYDEIEGEYIDYNHFPFEKSNPNPEEHLGLIHDIFSSTPVLNRSFKRVKVVHSNNLITPVPAPIFDKSRLQDYLKFTVKLLENDFISFDELDNCDIVNVYLPFININNFLIEKYGSFIYQHSATVLINKLLSFSKNNEDNLLFVNVNTSDFELVVIQNKGLSLYNRFNYSTREDFIYYILFVAEQLGLNPEEFQLTFLGEIEQDSELYEITYQYIRNVSFFEPASFPDLLKSESKHSNFVLLNQ